MIWHPSPNFGPRRNGLLPRLVVLHYTAMGQAAEALQRLCDPSAEVSAHYLIDRYGTTFQMVAEDMRAWHAGAGAWAGMTDINSRSIGIELVNSGAEPFALPQIKSLEALLSAILQRWTIRPVDVIGHSDMSPDRKQDPGRRFDWRGLARAGCAIWPDGMGQDADFDLSLDMIGYPQAPLPDRLESFRARFRPEATGPLAQADCARAARVADRFAELRATRA